MNLRQSAFSSRNVAATPVMLRLALYPNEVYRLPQAGECVRVVSGRAWLTAQGKDVILGPRDCVRLAVGDEVALVSSLHQAPAVLEVLD